MAKKVSNHYSGIKTGKFVRKAADLSHMNEMLACEWYGVQKYVVTEVWEMDTSEWHSFLNNFFGEYPFLKGKGGPAKVEGEYVNKAIIVRCGKEKLVVQPEGYDYPRYIACY